MKDQNQEEIIFEDRGHTPRFEVGSMVFLELAQKNRRLRAQATVVGWSHPNIVIVSLPADSRMLIVPTGTELVVRYLLDGAVYGFITRLRHKQQEPFGMWILDYPEVVEIKNLRRSRRIPLYLKVNTSEGGTWELIDLSSHGAAIVVSEEQFIGDQVQLDFTLPDGAKVQDLTATIVRVNYAREESIVGVQFDDADADNLQKIANYINECLRRQNMKMS